ncbi:MAG: CotH kinase family protein [Myxococcota bacterium]|nr:CotH kinase family protein [Myxococcota bacterium]
MLTGLALAVAAAAAGCGGNAPVAGDDVDGGPTRDAFVDPSAPLFDDSVLHEVRLTIDPSDLETLRGDIGSNTWYPATFEWKDQHLDQIGVRSRGLGSRNPTKPGFQVKFDRFVAGQKLLGLKTLVLDNASQDGSLMKERLVLAVFRSRGLPAPRIVHARLTINGVYSGVYTIVEAVTKPFLRRTLGDDDGNLYDYDWVDNFYFEPRPSYVPVPFQPKTNELNHDASGLAALIAEINDAPDADLVERLRTRIDLEALTTYLAIEAVVSERDGLAGDWGVNNFYLYQRADTQRFVVIPWDKDYTFMGAGQSIWAGMEANVLLRRLYIAPGPLRESFKIEAEAIVTSFVNARDLIPRIDAIHAQIADAVPADPLVDAESFALAVASLREFAFAREASVLEQVR